MSKAPRHLGGFAAHAYARATPHSRRPIVARHQQDWYNAHVAIAMGISRACATQRINPYINDSDAGLMDRASRPHTCPDVRARAMFLRRQFARGRDWITATAGAPARIISGAGAPHLPPLLALEPVIGELIHASKTTAVRY